MKYPDPEKRIFKNGDKYSVEITIGIKVVDFQDDFSSKPKADEYADSQIKHIWQPAAENFRRIEADMPEIRKEMDAGMEIAKKEFAKNMGNKD